MNYSSIYCVTIDKESARFKSFLKSFETHGYHPITIGSVVGKNIPVDIAKNLFCPRFIKHALHQKNEHWLLGTLGCFLSHWKIWEAIAKGGSDSAFIFEDDAILLEKLPANDFFKENDLIFISDRYCGKERSKKLDIRPQLKWDSQGTGSDGYWLSSEAARRLCQQLQTIDCLVTGVDGFLQSQFISKKDNFNQIKPPRKSLEKWVNNRTKDNEIVVSALTKPLVICDDLGTSYINDKQYI